MGRIQADTGLVSGINFTDTITKLMAIEAKPRDALTAKNKTLGDQQTAVTQLTALLVSFQFITKNLGKTDLFGQTTATSTNPNALTAIVTGAPAVGAYQYTPLRSVQSQQFLSSGYASQTSPLGTGTMTFRFGDGVARSNSLDALGGGQGFSRGKIQITDRSGATTQIDLSTAQTIDDVLAAINGAGTINVTATTVGGQIRLTDNTGQHASDLKAQEVGGGSTAASIGLAGVILGASANTNSGLGLDVLNLYSGIDLAALNDGAGVSTNKVLADIQYTLHDGTTGTIDLSPIAPGGSTAQQETTLGQIVQEVSTQTGGKLQVTISNDGKRLVATDTTSTPDPGQQTPGVTYGTLQLSAINGSKALDDLGLTGTTTDGSISGNRILGGLKTVLLSSLNGGQGLGTLGSLQLTDRDGQGVTVDLSGSETLDDIIGKINSQAATAGAGIIASINQAGDGIQLTDTTGGTGNLVAANVADGTTSADKLRLTGTTAGTSLQGKDLHLQVVAENTRLSLFNGGGGVALGTFRIADTNGASAVIDLSKNNIQTVGDVIDAINRASIGVHAQINATGDGISIQDTALGNGTLMVTEGTSTAAANLHLLAAATTSNGVQSIDGTTTHTIQLSNTDTLTDLKNKINTLGAGLTASILSDGSSKPYRLLLTSNQPGKIGNMVVDTSGMNMSLQQTAQGQDALLAIGGAGNLASSILISSSTNNFQDVLPGATLQVQNATGQPVTVNVTTSDTNIVANVQTFVDNYNKFRTQLAQDTTYDATTNTGAVLSSDSTALQLDTQLSDLLSGAFYGAGTIHSMAEIGVTMNQDGSLTFDQSKLQAAFAANPDAVQQFFTSRNTGVSSRFDTLIEQLAGQTNSLLSARLSAIQNQVADNQQRIDTMNARLANTQDRLYLQFYNMELILGQLKNSQTVINSLAPIEPYLGYTSQNSNG